jgi:hypothetical protein
MSQTTNRVYFATKALGVAAFPTSNYTQIHGAQSAGITTNLSLQNIQELGQLSVYQLIEQVPEIEVATEKLLDGNALIYHAATTAGTDGSLVGRSAARCMIALPVYGETQASATGTPINEAVASGMYVSQLSYTFGTDAPFRESVSFVGNEVLYQPAGSTFSFAPTGINNTDNPVALAGSGGVQQRYHLVFSPILGSGDPNSSKEKATALDGNGQLNAFLTILPPEVGVSSSGTNDLSAGAYLAHIQNITVSCNLGRDTILELGRKLPYYRFVTWPVQATTEIVVTSLGAHNLQAVEAGLDGNGNDAVNRTIKIRSKDGTWIDMGPSNKLSTLSWQGGNADGGNVSATYNFITYNFMTISHPRDPGGFIWPY